MTYGIKNHADKTIRYSQDNNSTEALIKKVIIEGKKSHLETCSATAFCTIIEGLGVIKRQPEYHGITIQPEDFFITHANDPAYDSEYNAGNVFDNRDLHTWDKIANKMRLNTSYLRSPDFNNITAELYSGNGCILLFPGHYVAAIAWDKGTDEIIYHNPWDKDPRNKNKGLFERINETAYNALPVKRALVIWR